MRHITEWTKIFKALANENRLKILYWLDRERELPVKAICNKIGRGVKITSKHLNLLAHVGILENHGKVGSVWYSIHPDLSHEVRHIITRFIRK